MKNVYKIALAFLCFVFIFNSCQLVENELDEEDEPTSTIDVRYSVVMTSTAANPDPVITYTNQFGGTTELNQLELDLTIPIDSGSTVFLSGSCNGIFSTSSRNSSAVVDIKIFVADSLYADSTDIQTQNTGLVYASALVSASVE